MSLLDLDERRGRAMVTVVAWVKIFPVFFEGGGMNLGCRCLEIPVDCTGDNSESFDIVLSQQRLCLHGHDMIAFL